MMNALSNEQILALNQGEVYFSESPSKFPEAGHGTQYHCRAAGLLKFARALRPRRPACPPPGRAELYPQVRL
jgi:hypothetical protein